MDTPHLEPAVPPPGPTPKKKIQLSLVGAGVAILIVSLLFSNTGGSARKSKLYSGQPQQPASPNDVHNFDAEARAQAERERQAALLAKKRQEIDAALQPPSDHGNPTESVPCQYTAQGCYGSQTQHTASAADTAAAERKAKRERQLHASTLTLDLPSQAPAGVANEPGPETKADVAKTSAGEKTKDSPLTETVTEKKTSVSAYDAWAGKLYRVFEGTLLEVVVKNRINGDAAGPIEAMLSNDIYSLNAQHLLLPKGTVFLGEARAVNQQFQQRVFVAFHRLLCPDGFSVNLDQFQGLTQRGDVGLQDQVNHHYVSIFGSAIALAAIGGVSNIGNGTTGLSYDPAVQFRSGIASETGQAANRVLDRFLNRLPTIVIREGARSRLFVSQDFLVPGYADHRMDPTL